MSEGSAALERLRHRFQSRQRTSSAPAAAVPSALAPAEIEVSSCVGREKNAHHLAHSAATTAMHERTVAIVTPLPLHRRQSGPLLIRPLPEHVPQGRDLWKERVLFAPKKAEHGVGGGA